MKTAIVILSYNSADDTLNCIDSILRYNTADVKFVIVDNASRTEEAERLKRGLTERFAEWLDYDKTTSGETMMLPQVTFLETGDNLGYARGNNAGLSIIENDDEVDNILILNSDVLFVEDIIPGLLKLQSSLDRCAILSPVLYKKGLKEYDYNCARIDEKVSQIINFHFFGYFWLMRGKRVNDVYPERFLLKTTEQQSGTIEIELPSGSCMLINKELFRSIGYFDPHTFLFYEENILFRKTRALGLKNYISLDHKCIHLGASTIGQHIGNKWLIDKALDSRRYYVKRYSGASKATVALYMLSERFYKLTLSASAMLKKHKSQ